VPSKESAKRRIEDFGCVDVAEMSGAGQEFEF
jgi:hypothetical protein